ncbi:unnamed protein product [Rotaria socialis]|uniref:Nose resistant-to-fluoxetine protein N-terminal domain-containing protein n=1 Tax=Rotaria socialis TaxID=392032 RepID=A0A821KS71_9BILA|nr:unnamed protein product [Rotaria socialis]CAF4538389.1 unnamed protein product [Rotaria socialis]CAF4741357.1 unnamed protein product [Rotaria socialis]
MLDVDPVADEIQNYLKLDLNCDDVLQFWQSSGGTFPYLKSLAQIILPIPATSTPSEQVFSTMGLILNAKRTMLLPENSTACEQDLETLIISASQRQLWALKVFDAWGKPLPSGLLTGNIYWLGNYDECINPLYEKNNKSFYSQPIDTQYCALQSNPSSQPVSMRFDLVLGLCMPSSCTRTSIVRLIRETFQIDNITENHLHCSNDRSNKHDEYLTGTIVFSIILSLLILLVLTGTIIDLVIHIYLMVNKTQKPKIDGYYDLSNENSNRDVSFTLANQSLESFTKNMPIIACLEEFSAIRTIRHIFMMNKTKSDNTFEFIDGIRVLSLFWVILGHSFGSAIYYTSNLFDLAVSTRNIAMQLIVNGGFAVDTFFFLSGFLSSVLFARQVRKERLSLRLMVLYYVHRYIRITPNFILVMFASIYLTPYFGRGPMYPMQQGLEPDKCRDGNWWTSFLYIGNFLKSDDICLGVTWYLYNDMQFHWIAPLALIPFVIGKRAIGYTVTVLFVLVSIGSTLGLVLYYPDMVKHALDLSSNATGPNFFDKVYMAPWCRISPYAIGLLVGFLVTNSNRTYHLNPIIKIIGTFVATALALTCIFSIHDDYVKMPGINRVSLITYHVLSRPAWSIAIAWLVFLCSIKQGGIVNRILSCAVWTPLARLNYSAYLIHNTIILITLFNQSNPVYYQPMTSLNNYVSQLFFSYLAAMVVFIVFETPFIILEKKIFKR